MDGGDGEGGGGDPVVKEDSLHCSVCHIPYSVNNPPFDIKLSQCAVCQYV